jgi:hypothetical protein
MEESNYKLLKNKDFLLSSASGIFFLIISLFINYLAGSYSMEKASNPVTDIILSNIPVFDVDYIFIYSTVTLVIFIALLCLIKVERIPFITKSIALFVVIRSIFISLTHIGPFPDMGVITSNFINKFTFGSDLFFSAHTGLPFLMALIFWEIRNLRYLFIALSLIFGTVVLLGHYHYTIDVLAAFFITFGVYHMAIVFFKKDYRTFFNDLDS